MTPDTHPASGESERLAAKLHEMFCGCAATEPEGDVDLWCDSIWLVLAERIKPILRECVGDMRAILTEPPIRIEPLS